MGLTSQPRPKMLIGRDDELRLISEALNEAMQRKPQMLVVSGDAGIGKSAIAEQAARLAVGRSFTGAGRRLPRRRRGRRVCSGAGGGPSLAARDEYRPKAKGHGAAEGRARDASGGSGGAAAARGRRGEAAAYAWAHGLAEADPAQPEPSR